MVSFIFRSSVKNVLTFSICLSLISVMHRVLIFVHEQIPKSALNDEKTDFLVVTIDTRHFLNSEGSILFIVMILIFLELTSRNLLFEK